MSGPLVRLDNLVRHFAVRGGALRRARSVVRAVDGVSLSIERGETVALVGESGCGKSTLARLVMCLLAPTEGRVFLDNVELTSLKRRPLRRQRRRFQIVFQDTGGSLNPRMTVETTLREPLTIHGLASGPDATARIGSLLHEVGLDDSLRARYPHELSGGQRQRVGIARALAVEPQFLVLDEPVSALDVSVRAQVLNLLVDLRRAHALTYLFIAHDLAVVRYAADRVAVMYLGRLVELGTAEAVYQTPRHPYTTSLLSAIPTPDPNAPRDRIVLTGDAPSAANVPSGCPFHPRCPHPAKDDRCRRERPELRPIGPGRLVACHYAETPLEPRG